MLIEPHCPRCGSSNLVANDEEYAGQRERIQCLECGFDSDVDPHPPTDVQPEPLLVQDESE